MFELSLVDLVKGLRAHPEYEATFISEALREIKEELRSTYPNIKANALEKLVYLQMLGLDISWASFHVVEVLSQPWFGHKRIAYLAAAQTFHKDTDVILLTTHLFKKLFTKGVAGEVSALGMAYEKAAALSCLGRIGNEQLAEVLVEDVISMLSSPVIASGAPYIQPYVLKKAILTLYKLLEFCPYALKPAFERLKEKLTSTDTTVVVAAVHVICELSSKNPKNYRPLAPILYDVFTKSQNNWLLIKIVKIFGFLIVSEPRLPLKLIPPLVSVISTTPAKSLQYECIKTTIKGLPFLTSKPLLKSTVQICIEKLGSFIQDSDSNLKYMGLLGLQQLLGTHPKVVNEYRKLLVECLSNRDVSIRMRALDLITGLVHSHNLQSIVRLLLDHLEGNSSDTETSATNTHADLDLEDDFACQSLERILDVCSSERYANITDFKWYLDTLAAIVTRPRLQRLITFETAKNIGDQLIDIAVRVPDIRPFLGKYMAKLLIDRCLLDRSQGINKKSHVKEVLWAIGWLVGELSGSWTLEECQSILEALLVSPGVTDSADDAISALPTHIQMVFIQSAMKIYVAAAKLALQAPEDEEKLVPIAASEAPSEEGGLIQMPFRESTLSWRSIFLEISQLVFVAFQQFVYNFDFEVQERAFVFSGLVGYFKKASQSLSKAEVTEAVSQCDSLFHEELNPVHPRAQRKVLVTEGLDLDAWIHEPPADPEEVTDHKDPFSMKSSLSTVDAATAAALAAVSFDDIDFDRKSEKSSKDKASKVKSAPVSTRKEPDHPFYLKGALGSTGSDVLDEFDVAPKVGTSSDSHTSGSGKSKDIRFRDFAFDKKAEPSPTSASVLGTSAGYLVRSDEELPEGAVASDDDDYDTRHKGSKRKGKSKKIDPLASIDLEEEYAEEELEAKTSESKKTKEGKKSKKEGKDGAKLGKKKRSGSFHGETKEHLSEDLSEEALAKLWTSRKFLCGDDIVRSKYECRAENDHLIVTVFVAFRSNDGEKLRSVHLKINDNPQILFPGQEIKEEQKHALRLQEEIDSKKGGILLAEKQKASKKMLV